MSAPFRCTNGDELPYMEKCISNYLHKTTALFGPSATGKTTIIREILFILKDVIPILVVIAPSDQSNESYSGVAPTQCIHDKFDIDIIRRVYERQKIACKVYNTANKLDNLMTLFKLIPNRKKEMYIISIIIRKYKEFILGLERNKNNETRGSMKRKTAEAVEGRDNGIRIVVKNCIRANRIWLSKQPKLDKTQAYVLKYLDFNPEILLILDDCADEFKQYNNHELIRMLFYKARHFRITFLISFQDDKDLDSSLRKGAHVKVFTNSNVAGTYFNRSANGFLPAQRKQVAEYIKSIYSEEDHNFEKLIYFRGAKKPYQVLLADEYEFRFGSDKLWQVTAQAVPPEEQLDEKNPFYDAFKVGKTS